MYDRNIDARDLTFEASGALLAASLVMRDKETDSWWSIMSSRAIGGELDGTQLSELPVSEKARWGDWRRRHPHTLALSVEGAEHVDSNPYQEYFDSNRTFRGLETTDTRLESKQPVFGFWVDETPHAAPFTSFEGGRAFPLPDDRLVVLTRERGAPIFASSRGYLVDASVEIDQLTSRQLLELVSALGPGVSPLEGFDTYWYTWISVNPGSRLLR